MLRREILYRPPSLWIGSLQVLCKLDKVTALIVPGSCARSFAGGPASGDPKFVHRGISQNVTGIPENYYAPSVMKGTGEKKVKRGGEKVKKGGTHISNPPSNTTDRSFLKQNAVRRIRDA